MPHTLLERTGSLAILTVNRPDKLNALNAEVLGELACQFAGLENDAAIRAVILTGAGEKAFIAGADIAAMRDLSTTDAKRFSDMGHALLARIERARFPVIAAVNGFALGGGCEVALACDFIYAADNAKFGQPEVNLGVIPGFGGTQRLARRIGIARAREWCMTGDIYSADECMRVGLVNLVVPRAELLDRAKATANKIAQKGPLAIAQAKRVLLRGADESLETANELEAQAFALLFGSADQKEGMSAFLEKRVATFAGR